MKHFTLVATMLFVWQTTFSNPIWTRVLDQPSFNKSYSTDLALVHDSLILVTGYTESFGCATNRLFAFNTQGELMWEKGAMVKFNRGGNFDLVHARDGVIFTVGFLYHDDYYDGTESLVISRLQPDGIVEYHTLYRGDQWTEDYRFIPVSMDVNPAGKMVIAGGEAPEFNTMVMTDAPGNVLWEKEYEFTVEQVLFLNEESLLLRSGNDLYFTDMNGDIIDHYSPDDLIVDVIVHDAFVYLLSASGLKKTDLSFETVEIVLEDEQADLEHIKLFGQSIWIMGKEDNQIVMINPDIINEKSPLYFGEYVDNADFVVVGDQVVFCGTSPSEQIGMYAFPSDQQDDTAYLRADIELLDFEISNVVINYENIGGETMATNFDFDAFLTLLNNGDEPVHAHSVFSLRSGGTNCAQQFFYENYDDTNILPGEEFILHVGSSNEYAAPGSSNELCFEILAPNSSLEMTTENNSLCKTFFITGVSDYEKDDFRIFPNPAKDLLYVSVLQETPFVYTITDTAGRVVLQNQHDGSTSGIDVSSLPHGIYILQMKVQNKILSSKFVKE